jgi:hypothetical protein
MSPQASIIVSAFEREDGSSAMRPPSMYMLEASCNGWHQSPLTTAPRFTINKDDIGRFPY